MLQNSMEEEDIPPAAAEAARSTAQSLEALQQLIRTPAGRAHLLERTDGFIVNAEGTSENIAETKTLIGAGYVPVLYANHQSHADKLVLSGVVQRLARRKADDQLTRFLVPVAA